MIRRFINLVEAFDQFGTTEKLYHGSCLDSLWLIMRDGMLDPDASGRSWAGPKGVCLTRNFSTARDHATSHMEQLGESFFDYFELGPRPPEMRGVIFEFDRAKIQQEIVPFDDFGNEQEEEERVLGPLPLEPALSAIYVNTQDIRKFVELAKQAYANGGQEYDDEFEAIIENVLSDPRLKSFD